MSFKDTFLNALISSPKLPVSFKAEDFLGQYISLDADSPAPLIHIVSGGIIKAVSPWSFDLRSLDCFLLLYTRSGCGKLLIDNQSHSLNADSLLFLDCRERFRLDLAVSPWEYQVLFLNGSTLEYYASLLPNRRFSILPLTAYSDVVLKLDQIFSQTCSGTIGQKLSVSASLNQIVTDCVTASLPVHSPETPVPSYIQDIKRLFDEHFQELFSLNELEARYGISKYRICREFRAAHKAPPLQYLNHRRIEMAKHLLVTSDARVHTIGSQVGIDNTNHFINLFKKYEGCTPLEYRQRMAR